MIQTADIVMGAALMALGYLLWRRWQRTDTVSPVDLELRRIIHSDQHKVKGRVETRAIDRPE